MPGAVAAWQDDEQDEDENLKQYMEQFFKAYRLGEFAPQDDPDAPAEAPRPSLLQTAVPSTRQGAQETMLTHPSGASAWLVESQQSTVQTRGASRPHPAEPERPLRPAKPPESFDDLRELRRLVNSNARRAINLYAFQQSVWSMRIYLTLGLVSIVCSCGLASVASATDTPAFALGSLTFLVAAFACLRYLRLIRCTSQPGSSHRHSR
jgi:hypothetical protein